MTKFVHMHAKRLHVYDPPGPKELQLHAVLHECGRFLPLFGCTAQLLPHIRRAAHVLPQSGKAVGDIRYLPSLHDANFTISCNRGLLLLLRIKMMPNQPKTHSLLVNDHQLNIALLNKK